MGRHGITVPVKFLSTSGHEQTFDVTFNLGDDLRVKEAFMRSTKEGNDISDLLRDGCILFSILLQHGETADAIASAMGENRGEGQIIGPPSSALGSIARAAAELDIQIQRAAEDAN